MSKLLTVVFALSVCLALCLPAFAADKPWPQKGDAVFVSSELVSVFTQSGPSHDPLGVHRETDIPACVPMTVRKAKPKKERWDIKNPVDCYHRMEGPWLPEFHRTVEECRARYTERGNPVIARQGHIHRIIPD